MEIKSRYLMSQLKTFDGIFMEIKSGFQKKIFNNQGNLL